MERTGPIAIALALILNVVLAIGWFIGPGSGLMAALMAGSAMAVLLLYGGSWLTMLHGEPSKRLIGIGVIALAVQLGVASVAGMSASTVVNGIAYLFAAAWVGALIPVAWATVTEQPVAS